MESKFIPVRGNPSFPTKIDKFRKRLVDFTFSRFPHSPLFPFETCRFRESVIVNTHRKRILQQHRNARQMHGAEKNLDRLRQHREEKPHMTCPSTPWAGFPFAPSHVPGALSRAASSRRDRPPTSVSKQSAHTVSPPCAHGHRYASSHAGSGAKHTSHRRIRIPPFRLQNYYAFG